MIRKITADIVFPVATPPIPQGVVVTDGAGHILALDQRANHDPASLETYEGVIVPGFVNTHCHLELSHMKGKVHTGTGLIPFITSVVRQRAAEQEVILDAIDKAETEMLNNGIVAVGDISNMTDTFARKSHGRLHYYTFVEMFDFLIDDNAPGAFAQYAPVYEALPLAPGSHKACVPHAPYSVSRSLFRMINEFNPDREVTISIHNQETPPENELFLHKTGAFLDFYQSFGISLDDFHANGLPSIHYALANMDPAHRTLFVHNVLTTRDDIAAAHAWSDRVYWATCPNANLYIENRLPDYQAFLDAGARMTIGTDSLTSNWQLCILEEMKAIARFQSFVPFETLLQWATLNGALALGFDDSLGSIETGKRPGLNLIRGLGPDLRLHAGCNVKKLA